MCIIFSLQTEVFASTRAIGETLEFIFKKAGVVVSKSYKTETEHMLSLAVKKHGDDILEIANNGGINALNCGMKYGDDFWDLCIKYPDSVKILTVNTDELLNLSKRIGPDFLKLETINPGITKQIVKTFGEDAVPKLVNHDSDDIIKLLHKANKTKNLKERTHMLTKFITPKNIMAIGFASGLVLVAKSISDGIRYFAQEYPILFLFSLGVLGVILLSVFSKKIRSSVIPFVYSSFMWIKGKVVEFIKRKK